MDNLYIQKSAEEEHSSATVLSEIDALKTTDIDKQCASQLLELNCQCVPVTSEMDPPCEEMMVTACNTDLTEEKTTPTEVADSLSGGSSSATPPSLTVGCNIIKNSTQDLVMDIEQIENVEQGHAKDEENKMDKPYHNNDDNKACLTKEITSFVNCFTNDVKEELTRGGVVMDRHEEEMLIENQIIDLGTKEFHSTDARNDGLVPELEENNKETKMKVIENDDNSAFVDIPMGSVQNATGKDDTATKYDNSVQIGQEENLMTTAATPVYSERVRPFVVATTSLHAGMISEEENQNVGTAIPVNIPMDSRREVIPSIGIDLGQPVDIQTPVEIPAALEQGVKPDTGTTQMDMSVDSGQEMRPNVDISTSMSIPIESGHELPLNVGPDTYRRVQDLLHHGQCKIDELMRYFLTLHEWCTACSADPMFNIQGLADSKHLSPELPHDTSNHSYENVQESNPKTTTLKSYPEVEQPVENQRSEPEQKISDTPQDQTQNVTYGSNKGFTRRVLLPLYPNLNGQFRCKICSFHTRRISELKAHRLAHSRKSTTCKFCGKINVNTFRKQIHMLFVHQKTPHLKKQAKCVNCGATFARQKSFHHHCLLHKKVRTVPKICNLCFKTVMDEQKHERLCKARVLVGLGKGDSVMCLGCGDAFKTPNMLRQHINYQHNFRRKGKRCICGRYFKSISRALHHQMFCKFSFRNVVDTKLRHKTYVEPMNILQMELPKDSHTLLENTNEYYATGLHVLADVSEHQSSSLGEYQRMNRTRRSTAMDLSSHTHDSSSPNFLIDSSDLSSNAHRSHFMYDHIDGASANLHQSDWNLRISEVSTLKENQPVHPESVCDDGMKKLIQSIHEDSFKTESYARRQGADCSESAKKERNRRNSGQGLERAISALKCKALSEMNRRRTTDDIILIKDEPFDSETVKNVRSSVDSRLTEIESHLPKTNHPSSVFGSNMKRGGSMSDTQESVYGTAVIDLSKVNIGTLSSSQSDITLRGEISNETLTKSHEGVLNAPNLKRADRHVPTALHSEPKAVKHDGLVTSQADILYSSISTSVDTRTSGNTNELPSLRIVSDRYHCPNCCQVFQCSDDLIKHIHSTCKLFLELLVDDKKGDSPCRICNLNFFSHKQAFYHHLKSVHGIYIMMSRPSKVLVCKVCGQKFMNDAYLREHMNGKHNAGARYSCTCGKTFKWRSSFSGHKRKCNGVITSTVFNRGRGKPLSNPRSRFVMSDSERNNLFDTTFSRLNSGHFVDQRPQAVPTVPKSNVDQLNSVPGIETLLANVRKERVVLESTPAEAAHKQHVENPMKMGASISSKQSNSLRISPKVKSFMEPIVQKATKGNLNRNSESRSLMQQQPDSNQSTDAGTHKRPTMSLGDNNVSGHQIDKASISKSNTFPPSQNQTIRVKQEHASDYGTAAKKTKQEQPDAVQEKENPPGANMGNEVVPDAMALGGIINPYMIYPNMFNIYPSNLQHINTQLSAPSQKAQAKNVSKGVDLPTSAANVFINPMMSVNSFVPFFAEALSTIQGTVFSGSHVSSVKPKTPSNTTAIQVSSNNSMPSASVPTPVVSSAVSSAAVATTSENTYFCDKCKTGSSSVAEYVNHTLTCKGHSLYCDICKLNFKCKASAREHMLGKHGGENRYPCPCGLRFKWRSSLGSHQRNCSKSPPKRSKIIF